MAAARHEDPTRFRRIRALTEAAMELAREDREAFLARECGEDTALIRDVRALLAVDAATDESFLSPPGSVASLFREEPSSALEPGALVGPWRIERQVAAGGMGVVYQAARADRQFEKQVALKVMKRGLDTDDFLLRFARERQVLAGLEHPNIARLLDAGALPDGRPYIVMEWVEGETIDRAFDAMEFGVRERVERFIPVCAAVHYAHQRLVVHRDLKPGNILVTADGEPKLLDFGIAKVLQRGDGSPSEEATIGGSSALTPHYASPEQVANQPVTTATDVYSLGVVLFELLVGRRPYDLSGRSWSEVERAIRDEPPPIPSRAAALEGPPDRARELRGELDAVILRAMAKEPERRYASAEQLAQDLERYLSGFPVVARPDSLAYRGSRFVRRNKLAVGLAALVVASLAAGLTATWIQFRKAVRLAGTLAAEKRGALELAAQLEAEKEVSDRRFQDLREFSQGFLSELDPLLQGIDGTDPAREYVVRKGLSYLERLQAEARDDRDLLRDVVRGYLSISNLQGGVVTANLGRPDEAASSVEKALAAARSLHETDPGDPTDTALLARCLLFDGRLAAYRGTRSGEESFREAMAVLPAKVTAESSDELLDVFSAVLEELSGFDERAGRYREAEQKLGECLAAIRLLVERNPDNPHFARGHATTLASIAKQQTAQGRLEESEATAREAVAVLRALCEKHPRNRVIRRDLQFALSQHGDSLLALKRADEAEATYREVHELARETAEKNPADKQAVRDLMVACARLAGLLLGQGRVGEAEPVVAEQVRRAEALYRANPRSPVLRRDYAVMGATYYARVLKQLGRPAEAVEQCAKALPILQALAEEQPGLAEPVRDLGVLSWDLANAHTALADAAESRAEERAHLRAACDAFAESVGHFETLKQRGQLQPSDEAFLEEHRAVWRACEERLAEREAGSTGG